VFFVKKEVVEQYLKTILSLSEDGKPVKTTDISKKIELAPATVTESIQKLASDGLVEYEPYHGTTLTEKGLIIATKIRRKHRLLERFLSDMLGIESSKVHEQACEMEHTLSDEAEVALCRILNHPETCSDDGQSIPPCGLDVESCVECKDQALADIVKQKERKSLKPLTDLGVGEKATIQFIRGGRSIVQRLNSMGLTKGTQIRLQNSSPFSGPVEISVRGCKVALGRGVAKKIFVQ